MAESFSDWRTDARLKNPDPNFLPYTFDERRIAEYLHELTPDIGAGADPTGFLIASHRALMDRVRELPIVPEPYPGPLAPPRRTAGWGRPTAPSLVSLMQKPSVIDISTARKK